MGWHLTHEHSAGGTACVLRPCRCGRYREQAGGGSPLLRCCRWAARFFGSVVPPRAASRALHSAALRSASAAPMALRATLDPARSSTGEKRAGGPEGWVAHVGRGDVGRVVGGVGARRRVRARRVGLAADLRGVVGAASVRPVGARRGCRQQGRCRGCQCQRRERWGGCRRCQAGGWVPWHSPYAWPEPHQQTDPRCGGQATARPRAASVVAYCGSRVASSGEESSEAAKAS